jgi:hypothetical protein
VQASLQSVDAQGPGGPLCKALIVNLTSKLGGEVQGDGTWGCIVVVTSVCWHDSTEGGIWFHLLDCRLQVCCPTVSIFNRHKHGFDTNTCQIVLFMCCILQRTAYEYTTPIGYICNSKYA